MLKVGDTVYTFNYNRRVYEKGSNSAPIYAQHFAPVLIVGETKISWITEYGEKYKKKFDQYTPFQDRLLTEEEKEQAIWMHENQHQISEKVRRSNSYEKLVKIKEILEG